jgi:hypothetical protein
MNIPARFAAGIAALALLGVGPSAATTPKSAIVTCSDGARLYLIGQRNLPGRAGGVEPNGSQVTILDGPRSFDIGALPFYEINVPTLHRPGDGDFYWVSSACLTFTN